LMIISLMQLSINIVTVIVNRELYGASRYIIQ
jgi:hypothetical protein